MEKKNILVVSGCMAIQSYKGNIIPEDLYPNVLKEVFLKEYNHLLNFEIITYNELNQCYEKFKEKFESNPADLIIFQVRCHYYLKMVNVFSTYKTIERFNSSKKVKSDNRTKLPNRLKNTLIKRNDIASIYALKILRFLNGILSVPMGLFLGSLSGSERFSKSIYKDLIMNVLSFSKQRKVPIVFLGVTSRPNNIFENLFSNRLNKYFETLIYSLGETYISIFGKFTSNNEYKFVNNSNRVTDKISLSKVGHREVAEKLTIDIQKLFVKSNLNKSFIEDSLTKNVSDIKIKKQHI